MSWWKNRHGFAIERDWLVFCTGVVPAISSIVRKLTTVGENVVVMTPVYNIFFNSIINNGRKVLESKLADSQTTMLLLCNPHNPIGKIWDRGTLQRIGQMCADNNVLVVSDEIHCDIVKPGLGYIPFASVSDVCRAYRNGEGFLRMNLACPRALLEDGLKRLKESMTGKEVC